jgi:hypothetical protein
MTILRDSYEGDSIGERVREEEGENGSFPGSSERPLSAKALTIVLIAQSIRPSLERL